MATNAEVAAAFEELAVLSEILGANVFKVNAFRKAARAVEGLAQSAVAMEVAALREIDGLGASTAAKVHEFGQKGTMSELEELRAQVPAGLKEVLAIQGIGPRRRVRSGPNSAWWTSLRSRPPSTRARSRRFRAWVRRRYRT